MNENQENKNQNQENEDLKTYLNEIEHLKMDFSDLEDLDMEEIQEMQNAIAEVKEYEKIDHAREHGNVQERESASTRFEDEIIQRETMLEDFSDIDALDLDELKDMKDAIEGVKQETDKSQDEDVKLVQPIQDDLEARIKKELFKKLEVQKKETITPESFLEYIKTKKEKIWYHALWYLVFEVEDHTASKVLLYDVLKEKTSKNPIDPIPEHQFYFGLGYILRLNMNDKQIIRYMGGGKFKININVETLKTLLEESGEPLINRPIIPKEEKKKMFSDFLKDDFQDI